MADISKPSESVVKNVNPVPEQNKPTDHDNGPKDRTEVVVKLVPCPNCNDESAKKTKDPSQYPKRILAAVLAIVPIFISIYAAVISTGSQSASWDSARNSGRSADAAGKTADAAQKNVATAQAALKATIENSRLDQRAWVGLGDLKLVGQAKVGTPMEFSLGMKNSGRTPALRVTLRGIRGPALPETLGSLRSLVTSATPIGSYVIPPGETYFSFLSIAGEILTEQDVTNINEGRVSLYVVGMITYEDIFKTADSTHETLFCAVYRYKKDRPQFLPFCKEEDYNQMK